MLKCSLKIPYSQGALTTRSNYEENWCAETFPYEEGASRWYAKNFLMARFTNKVNPGLKH